MHIAKQIGINNNGHIPYSCDYNRDYSPPLHSLNSLRTNNTSLKSHLISSAGHPNPSINPITTSSSVINMNNTPTNYMNGHLPIDHYSLGRHRQELRQDNGLPSIQMNTMPINGIISMYPSRVIYRNKNYLYRNSILDQSMLNNVDPRYSATYGNPFLRNSNPLPPPSTANPAVTPAPPPYSKPPNTSNSSFSSSTTVSNHASLLGPNYGNPSSINIAPTATTPSQVTSPSRQFILPANGDLKKGSLATHV